MPATGGYFHPTVASKNNPTTIARTQIGLTVLGHNLRILAKLQEKRSGRQLMPVPTKLRHKKRQSLSGRDVPMKVKWSRA